MMQASTALAGCPLARYAERSDPSLQSELLYIMGGPNVSYHCSDWTPFCKVCCKAGLASRGHAWRLLERGLHRREAPTQYMNAWGLILQRGTHDHRTQLASALTQPA